MPVNVRKALEAYGYWAGPEKFRKLLAELFTELTR